MRTAPNELTILTDFDGVIRHWDNKSLIALETELEIPNGTTFQAVFDPELTAKAITGELSHDAWVEAAGRLLDKTTTHSDALIAEWVRSTWQIDHDVLDLFSSYNPTCLALLTNATDRLDSDLKAAKLGDTFDLVVNASAIGVAKPAPAFYLQALEMAQITAAEAVFIDDRSENVSSAEALGIRSHLFETFTGLKRFLDEAIVRDC